MVMSDGPAGGRITQHYTRNGQDYYQFATAFPVGTCLAQTWDVEALEQFGYAVGEEMKEFGVTSWLAPGMNIHRNPICGRNFEYYSEDPLLSGMTAAYTTKGVQTHTGLGVTLKHFWGNNQEANRGGVNNVISERASREIYTKGFEIAVKLAHPMFMMACYQANNGWYGSNNYDTLVNLLRGEWGWEGLVMTDWGGGRSTVAIDPHMGNDLIMPGGNVNNILNGYRTTDPTFNADGSIRNRGNFVVTAGGSASYTTATNAASEEELIDSIKDSIANREAKYQKIGSDATITWYGEIDRTGKTCLGDLQYAAYNILSVALNSQDMEKIMDEAYPDEGFKAQSITELYDAPLAGDYAMVEKGEVADAVGIIADTVTVDTVETESTGVDVSLIGDEAITTARLFIKSALPIADIESDYDFEFNPADGRIIVYDAAGEEIDGVLFTIIYEFDAVIADGEYPIDLKIIEVTGADGELTDAIAIDGAIIVDNVYPQGRCYEDGSVDNRDLIMLARYLVGL